MTPDAFSGGTAQWPGAAALALSAVLLHRRHLRAMLHAYAAQAVVLALAAAWQGAAHGASQLYLVAVVALAKAAVAPRVLHLVVQRPAPLPRHSPRERPRWRTALGRLFPRDGSPEAVAVRHPRTWPAPASGPETVGLVPLALGAGLVALAAVASAAVQAPARVGLVLALSVLLLGLLVAATRRDAPARAMGLLSSENGVALALVGAPGMPLAAGLSAASLALAACAAFGACASATEARAGVERLDPDRGPR